MKKLTLQATLENINVVTDFVDAELEAHNCGMKVQVQINIAIDELFGNIAQYSYAPETGEATVTVDFTDDNEVVLTLIDSGMQFDPVAKEDPDVTLSAEERGIGGLGIYMVKKSMDKMMYEYKDGQNILTLVKKM